ncbi:hypothetical protein P0Y35_00935 [Kiritimatiellaeota bacterium B1221]|nr:hypothetical protein [Kiritimatiellaeota bacterium B1221]
MKDFMGINGHFQFKPDLYAEVCRLARNYHNVNWDVKAPGDELTFPQCPNGVNWIRDVYGKWAKEGFEIDLCVQFGTFGESNEHYQTLWQGQEAWSYRYGFELAKTLGASGKRAGVTSIEIGNEPGNDFDDALYQKLFLQMARGIRDADPELKIVTATAQAGEADKYVKSLEETFSSPEIKALYDVINLHVYATLPPQKGRQPWARSFPEDPQIDYLKVVDAAVGFRNREAPGKEVWITEFGYDACTPEAMEKRESWAKKLNWEGQTDVQQAQYLVRSFLCFSEMDVERAYLYYFNDQDQASVHAASGLTRNFEPKPSFWAVKQLYEILGDYRFHRVVSKEPGGCYVFSYQKDLPQPEWVWVLWSATGEGNETFFTLQGLPGKAGEAVAMSLTEAGGLPVEIDRKRMQIRVGESPVYLKISP